MEGQLTISLRQNGWCYQIFESGMPGLPHVAKASISPYPTLFCLVSQRENEREIEEKQNATDAVALGSFASFFSFDFFFVQFNSVLT